MHFAMDDEKKTNICRVCLQSDNNINTYVSLFQHYNTSLLFHHITSIANVKIREGDGFPDKICTNCFANLETAINFKQKCETSDAILRKSPKDINITRNKNDTVVAVKEEHLESHYLEPDDFFIQNLQFEETVDVKDVELQIDYSKDQSPQCNDCGEFFKSKCKLRVHWKKVHKPKSYVCQDCRRLFKSYTAYNKHLTSNQRACSEIVNGNSIRVEGEGKNRLFCCTQCDYKSNRMIHTRAHLVVHSGMRPFKCDLCPKAYTQRGPLDIHKEIVHSDNKPNTECHFCGKLFKGRRRLYRHLKIHTEPKYQCDICKAFVKGKKSLKVHMVRHSGVKNMTCELCAATFFTSAELCNHKKTHNIKEKLYKCNMCDYRAATKWQVQRHAAKHAGDKPYPCTTCGAFFSSLQSLNLHEVRHFEEKKFACPMCEKMFFRKRSISKHIIQKHKSKMLTEPKRIINVKQEHEVLID